MAILEGARCSDSRYKVYINTDLVASIHIEDDLKTLVVNGSKISFDYESDCRETFNQVVDTMKTKMDIKDYIKSIDSTLKSGYDEVDI